MSCSTYNTPLVRTVSLGGMEMPVHPTTAVAYSLYRHGFPCPQRPSIDITIQLNPVWNRAKATLMLYTAGASFFLCGSIM